MLQVSPNNPKAAAIPTGHKAIHPLNNRHREEVLNFLDARPVHTFIMSSWINDNGLVSSFNRGIFYGCRDTQGALEGVALIGHITLFETKSNAALTAFAKLTQSCASPHAVLGEGKKISRFRSDYTTNGGAPPRLVCRELLLEKCIAENLNTVQSLRPARSEDLELVVPIHAQTAFEESGVNPLEMDPSGFRERCARRIKQGRTWVAIEDGRLKFKADIVSDTPKLTKRTRRRRLHTGKRDTSSVSTTTRFTSSTNIRQLITYQDHEQTTLLQAFLGFHRGRRGGRLGLFPASLAHSSA